MPKFIFFSDLDGTLLDSETYSFTKAKKGLEKIKESESRLVLCTSKSKSETLEYEQKLALKEPFIVENGGAVYIPQAYFKHEVSEAEAEGSFLVIRLGASAGELERTVDELGKEVEIKAFHSMPLEELIKETGLSQEQALKAREKQFIASFKLVNQADFKKAEGFLSGKGVSLQKGGRFYAVGKGNDKGKAVETLIGHFRKEFASIVSVGIGDSENDFGMLKACDRGFLVAQKKGKYASDMFEKAKGAGPEGWNHAVLSVLSIGGEKRKGVRRQKAKKKPAGKKKEKSAPKGKKSP